jgi:hypothetical protein
VISGALFQSPVSSDSANAQIMVAALKTSPAPIAKLPIVAILLLSRGSRALAIV